MRRAFKVLLWVVLGPLGLMLLVALAWVAFNGSWADATPQPVPPDLLPQAVTLAPVDNAFFDGQGLRAPEGESPNAWGRHAWLGATTGNDALLVVPTGDDWNCRAGKDDCMVRWRASAAKLDAQMAGAPTFGERCKALADRTSFQEPLPARRPQPIEGTPYEALPLPQFSPLTTCMRWLQVEAVLAPDVRRAEAAWTRANALLRLFASGTQTLVGQAVAWSWVTRHQQLLAQWSAERPAGYVLPAAWQAPLPSRLLLPRAWMVAESHWQRETMAGMRDHGEQMFSMDPGWLQSWAGRHGLGYLPELTAQATAAHWLTDLRLFGDLQGPALALAVLSKPETALTWWDYLSWRNTIGHILAEVARPHYERYALRQADLVLYQAALDLSQRLNTMPAADRPAWWARQPLDTGIRERLSLEGDAVLIRTWRGDTGKDYAAPVRFPLRPA